MAGCCYGFLLKITLRAEASRRVVEDLLSLEISEITMETFTLGTAIGLNMTDMLTA